MIPGASRTGRIDPAVTTFTRYLAPGASQQLFLAGVLMYDLRPDRVGWTVYDIDTHRPVVLDGLVLTGLEHKLADELVSLLNRSVYGPSRKRLGKWPLMPTAARHHGGKTRSARSGRSSTLGDPECPQVGS